MCPQTTLHATIQNNSSLCPIYRVIVFTGGGGGGGGLELLVFQRRDCLHLVINYMYNMLVDPKIELANIC